MTVLKADRHNRGWPRAPQVDQHRRDRDAEAAERQIAGERMRERNRAAWRRLAIQSIQAGDIETAIARLRQSQR